MAAAAQIEPVGTEPMIRPKALGFAPELELLLACSWPVSDREPHLAAILGLQLNWDSVLRLADHHRLLPALHAALGARDDVPASIRSAISARFQNHERRVLRFNAELARIWRQFERYGIPALAHKGAALGQLLYADPAQRQFGDLDCLVRAADVPRARSALQELGYTQKIHLSARQEKKYLRSGYEHVFGINADHNLVEVQWQIVPRFYSIHFDMEALFARSVELDLDGLRLRTLVKEDQMLVLCVHAAKHEWMQLAMLRDIATLARSDLNWDWIGGEARRLGIARILSVSLLLAQRLLGLNVPQLFQHNRDGGPVAEVESALIRGADPDPETAAYFRRMMRLRERWQDRVRLILRLTTTPSVGEWQTVRIPDSCFPLYHGVRALRLLRRLFRG